MIKATAQSSYGVEPYVKNPHVLFVRSGIFASISSCFWVARNALLTHDEL